MLGKWLIQQKISSFYRKRPIAATNLPTTPYPSDNNICEIICITYNNPALLPLQWKLIKKNIEDPYHFLVADNSSDPKSRDAIAEFCLKNKILYIPLPPNPFKNSSQSHAVALNWLVKNYILLRKPAYFGFIDHDIFPIEAFSPAAYLSKQGVYGLYQERPPYWYLWAGFCFFNYKGFDISLFDFMPGTVNGVNLDTGGKNWDAVYAKLDKTKINFPTQTYENLRDGEIAQSDKLERIGAWLHSFNGSYWMKVDAKEHLLEAYLNKYL